MATSTKKFSNIQQHMIDEQNFKMIRVQMYKQANFSHELTSEVITYEGLGEITDSGLIWVLRPEANMRSRFKKTVLASSSAVISAEVIPF